VTLVAGAFAGGVGTPRAWADPVDFITFDELATPETVTTTSSQPANDVSGKENGFAELTFFGDFTQTVAGRKDVNFFEYDNGPLSDTLSVQLVKDSNAQVTLFAIFTSDPLAQMIKGGTPMTETKGRASVDISSFGLPSIQTITVINDTDPVPEPSTCVLLSTGILGLFRRMAPARKRRANRSSNGDLQTQPYVSVREGNKE